jgi:hypothetical protein
MLTLLVVPVFYTVFDDVGGFFRRLFGLRESARVGQVASVPAKPVAVEGD